MTDYAVPATPGEVLRRLAEDHRYRAGDERRQAAEHETAAKAWEQAARAADSEANQYDRWQPKPSDDEEPRP